MSWYHDSHFLLHIDHPHRAGDRLAGLDRDQVLRALERIRPDAVSYTAKGHSGFVPYASRYGNGLFTPYEDGDRDVLGLYREVTRELGIRFVIGYSGLVDHHAGETRPDWQRVRHGGLPYPARMLCTNSGYVEELMLPQLDEIVEQYEPDGIWTDAENWTVSPCYCQGCESDYQMLHQRSAPIRREDPFWPEWLQFHRECFQRHLSRVALFLHHRREDLVYASSAACCTHQPERPATGLDRLCSDLSPAFSLRQAGLEARFLDRQGTPFDLMTSTRCSARPRAHGNAPPLPLYSKTPDHMAQEGAVVLANGGRWTVWLADLPDGAFPDTDGDAAAEAAAFTRERATWCRGTTSGASVALLHSRSTHEKAGNGLYDPGPSLDRIRGAHQALQELHHPHDVLTEDTLGQELERYRLLILPEQIDIPLWLDEPIARWVSEGGRLIASGRVSPRINEDIPTFALEEVLGIRWTGRREGSGVFHFRDRPLEIAAPVYYVAAEDAETVWPLLSTARDSAACVLDYPAVTRRAYGSGEAFYIASDLFAAYHRSQYPGLRELLGEVIDLALPEPPLQTDAPPTIECVLRTREGETILHMVDHNPGKSLAQNNPYIEQVPPALPFTVALALPERPASVLLQPGGREIEWSWEDGRLTAEVVGFHVHATLAITRT